MYFRVFLPPGEYTLSIVSNLNYQKEDSPGASLGWYLACLVIFTLVARVQFSYHPPRNNSPTEVSIVFWITILAGTAAILEYIRSSTLRGYSFQFDEHFYGANYDSTYIPLISAFLFIRAMIVHLRQINFYSRSHRRIDSSRGRIQASVRDTLFPSTKAGKMARSFLILSLGELMFAPLYQVGVFTNILSQDVLITFLNACLMFIYPGYVVARLNSGRQNVTFMVKNAGVALVFILVLASLIGSRSIARVNKGDLNVRVPVDVQDEVGYLTRTFNGMVTSIRIAHKQLEEHADNLELKVQERAQALQTSLEEVEVLKRQQGMDYYLSPLPVTPRVFTVFCRGPVRVEYRIKQKKLLNSKGGNMKSGETSAMRLACNYAAEYTRSS